MQKSVEVQTTAKQETHMQQPPIRAKENFLVFGSPLIGEEEGSNVAAVLKSGWIGTGSRVAQFERDFAAYKGVEHVAAVNSCTAALHLSMKVLGLAPGDEVITTPMTFCATVNSIIHAGATPVLADIDPVTMNIDPKEVKARLSPRTKAVIPVHFAGRPCDMDGLNRVLEGNDIAIIEDCAHAIETQYHGQNAGTFGDFSCFSFYVTKNVVTGEGGIVVAKRPEDIARVKVLGLHGMTKDAWKRFSDEGYMHYNVIEAGFKYNMTDMQAAIGIPQLQRIESNWTRRREIWDQYNSEFAGLPVHLPAEPEPETRHAYHLYTILIDEVDAGITRDQFLKQMTSNNIGIGVHYLSIPEHSYYQTTYGWKPDDYPHASRIGRQTVSLPLSAKLTEKDVNDVVSAVHRILGGRKRH